MFKEDGLSLSHELLLHLYPEGCLTRLTDAFPRILTHIPLFENRIECNIIVDI